jgi:hypothetical protein
MSLPKAAPPEPGIHTPVFVDDSGRRRARLRIVVRVVVGILGLYLVLATASLVAPVSFPIAHLGNLGVLPRHRQNATLGPRSKEAPLPPALRPTGGAPGNPQVPTATTIGTSQTSTPGSTTPAGIVPPGQSTTPATRSTIPTSQTTTAPSSVTTTSTKGRPTATTLPHGPSTTGPHGPPSTTPGKGSKP